MASQGSDIGKGLGSVGEALNPFGLPGQLASFLGSTLSPTVEWAASNTVGLVYGDKMLNFTFVLLFMVSLLCIVLSDHVAMTATFRTFLLKLHFVFIKCVRAVVTIGLFFLGRAIGKSSSFMEGLEVGAPIVTAAASLFVLLRFVESVSMTVPGQNYNAQNKALGPVPFIRGTMFFQTTMQVVRDYLSAVVDQCTDALIGGQQTAGTKLFSSQVNSADGSTAPTANIRYLWQAYDIDYTREDGTVFFGSDSYPTDQSWVQSVGGVPVWWAYSPLFAGLFAGLITK
jgi:hypothetical protein